MVSEDPTIFNGKIPEIIVLKLWAIPSSVAISYERPRSCNFIVCYKNQKVNDIIALWVVLIILISEKRERVLETDVN